MNKELAKTLTTALVQFIDRERPGGTMCCSNAECESIEKMFEGECYDIIEAFIQKKLSRLTEFEKAFIERVFHQKPEDLDEENKEIFLEDARFVFNLAREQLIKDGYVIEKKAFHDAVEKVSPEVMKEVSDEIDEMLEKEQKPSHKFNVGDTIHCKYDDREFTIKSVDLANGVYKYTKEGCGNDIDYADENFELVEQKPAEWDEFDEDCLKRAALYIENPAPSMVKDTNLALWLKSLPGRFNFQPKQEWNDEDERKYQCIRNILLTDMSKKIDSWKYSEILEWYEKRGIGRYTNFKPHWKPSEEQMEAFKKYIEEFQARAEAAVGGWNNFDVMIRLYEQLKKL